MKKFLILLVFTGVASFSMAQQASGYEEITTPDKYRVLTNRFGSNWFFSLGGGATVLFGEGDVAGSFTDRISPTLNVAVGKWFTPGLGLRLQYSGLQAKGFTYNGGADYIEGGQQAGGYYDQKFDYMNLHGDILFNLSAMFGGYDSKRVYEFIPYLGAGATHTFTTPHRQSMSINGGIINRFRLGAGLDLNLELAAVAVEDKFDSEMGGHPGYDALGSVTLGITYKFPKRGFKRPAPQLVSEAELRAIRQGVAELAIANEALAEELARKKAELAVERAKEQIIADVDGDDDIAPRAIFFEIGSAKISPREKMDLQYLAEHIKKSPDSNFIVLGYADSATGTSAINQKLSEKRAKAVVDFLVKEHGIDANRLNPQGAGGVSKFGKPVYLNRVVLVESR